MIAEQERLPRRDWILLPLLSLLSFALVLALGEVVARLAWPEQQHDRCVLKDPVFGFRFQPDCVALVKSPETPWLENAYNSCGFRTAESCGPKPSGGFRVALIGSSISSGYLVPYAESFPARATIALKNRCHIPVDFQNLAVPGTGLETAALHVNQALALHPDFLLMAISTHDLEIMHGPETPAAVLHAAAPAHRGLGGFAQQLAIDLRASRAGLVAQHFLYQNPDSYLRLYLQHGDEADYLRPPLTKSWQGRLATFDQEVGEIAERARGDGVQFMLVFVPARAQAMVMQWQHRPPGIDPTLLGRALAELAERHGVVYVDLTSVIGERPDAASLYYPVDSHPNATGSAVIADAVVNSLLSHDASFAACRDQTRAGN